MTTVTFVLIVDGDNFLLALGVNVRSLNWNLCSKSEIEIRSEYMCYERAREVNHGTSPRSGKGTTTTLQCHVFCKMVLMLQIEINSLNPVELLIRSCKGRTEKNKMRTIFCRRLYLVLFSLWYVGIENLIFLQKLIASNAAGI